MAVSDTGGVAFRRLVAGSDTGEAALRHLVAGSDVFRLLENAS